MMLKPLSIEPAKTSIILVGEYRFVSKEGLSESFCKRLERACVTDSKYILIRNLSIEVVECVTGWLKDSMVKWYQIGMVVSSM